MKRRNPNAGYFGVIATIMFLWSSFAWSFVEPVAYRDSTGRYLTVDVQSVTIPACPSDADPSLCAEPDFELAIDIQIDLGASGRYQGYKIICFGPIGTTCGRQTIVLDFGAPSSVNPTQVLYRVVTAMARLELNFSGELWDDKLSEATVSINQKDIGCEEGSLRVGNPCNPANGNKYQFETDYDGGNNGLTFTRHYNSRLAGNVLGASVLGAGWTSARLFDRLMIGQRSIILQHPDGRGIRFFRNTDGGWDSEADTKKWRLIQDGWGYTAISPDSAFYRYDLNGRIQSQTDRVGRTTIYSFDANGRLSSVTGPYGHQMAFAYEIDNRLQRLIDPSGGVYSYTYDANNNLTSVTYPDNKIRTYLYEDPRFPNALTGIVDENGSRFATYAYDTQGRAISSEHFGGVEKITLVYNADGSAVVTDTLGTSRTYRFQTILGVAKNTGITQSCASCGGSSSMTTYDTNGNVTAKTDFNGVTTTYTYDLARNLETSRTEAYGTPQARTVVTEWHPGFRLPTEIIEPTRVSTFTYDAQGNLLQKTLSSGAQSRTWTYTYNSLGQVLTANGPRTDTSDITTYSYDTQGNLSTVTNALGHVTRFTAYDAHGRPLTVQDPNGLITQLAYDPRGRLISRAVGGEVTAYKYDGVGQLIKVILPDASVINYTYDAAHRLTGIGDALGNRIAYTLDLMGNRIKEDIYDPNGALTQTRSRIYNALNRLAQDIGAQNQSTAYQYDASGNLTGTTNPLSYSSANTYDALNRLIQVTDPAGGITRYAYDANDRLTQVTDPRGIGTAYSYDGLGNLTQTISLDTGATVNTYDANGNLTAQTDARDRKTTYAYDAANRLTKTTFADATAITWQYDTGANGLGRLAKMADPSGNTQWTYNSQGRVLSKIQLTGTISQTLSYAYNSAGRLSQITYPSGKRVGYGYDASGRIASLTLNGQPLLSGIQYQPHGPAKGWTWGNGASYTRAFDADGRLISHPQGNLSYDAASRLVLQQTPSGTHSYGYDASDRLTGYAHPVGATSNYQYDANGNRTRLSQSGATTDYIIPATSNRLTAQTSATSKSYSYDAAGNLTGDGTNTYTYNARGRLSKVAYGGNKSNTYAVNGLGQRVMKTGTGVSTGTNRYVYDEEGHLLGEYNSNGSVIQETVYLGDTPVAVLTPTAAYYLHADHLDTPRALTDTTNKVIWRWDSDPFGATAANEDPDGDGIKFTFNLRFPGQYFDKETGLHYNYHRYYDPNTGRYMTADPISVGEHVLNWSTLRTAQHSAEFREQIIALGDMEVLSLASQPIPPLELNPYAYVANNPLLWTDSTGESIGGFGGFGGSSTSGGLQCGDDDKKKKNCAALRDNIINQTCKSIRNGKARMACFAAAWATYLACLAED